MKLNSDKEADALYWTLACAVVSVAALVSILGFAFIPFTSFKLTTERP